MPGFGGLRQELMDLIYGLDPATGKVVTTAVTPNNNTEKKTTEEEEIEESMRPRSGTDLCECDHEMSKHTSVLGPGACSYREESLTNDGMDKLVAKCDCTKYIWNRTNVKKFTGDPFTAPAGDFIKDTDAPKPVQRSVFADVFTQPAQWRPPRPTVKPAPKPEPAFKVQTTVSPVTPQGRAKVSLDEGEVL